MSKSHPDDQLIPIAGFVLSDLRFHMKRTQKSPMALVRNHPELLKGIKPSEIEEWVQSYGAVPKAKKADLLAVQKAWATEPTKHQFYTGKESNEYRIEYTDEMHQELLDEIRRTNMYSASFYRKFQHKIPSLTLNKIGELKRRYTKTVLRAEWKQILKLYKSLPAKAGYLSKVTSETNFRLSDQRTPITETELSLLRHYRDQLGILPSKVFENADDIPQGLRPSLVVSWLSGNTSTAESGYVEWVLNRCHRLLKDTLHGAEEIKNNGNIVS